MEFKGTKGKWLININHNIVSETNSPICDVWHFNKTDEETKSNALLISKAPEMLEMLQNISRNEMITPNVRRKADKLIKEATEL